MLSLKMVHGSRDGLNEMNSILLSESVAKTYFNNENPIGKVFRIDNAVDVKVTGVYEDFPYNSSFRDMTFILPWSLYLSQNKWVTEMEDPWDSNFTRTFAMINTEADMEKVSTKIKDVKLNKVRDEGRRYNPAMFLHPMRKWHLYSDFKNGVNTGGQIDNVWLFSTIGIFVLILACINFMNLSTARSEKRAKEVGIRKAIGSARKQLITQFFSESMLIAALAFVFSVLLVFLVLPYFNSVADKKISLPWAQPVVLDFRVKFQHHDRNVRRILPCSVLIIFSTRKSFERNFPRRSLCLHPAKGAGGAAVYHFHHFNHRDHGCIQADQSCAKPTDWL